MFSTLRTRFGIPGVISVIALVFAMLGGAYAANNSSSGGKATASKAKKAKGKRGARGPRGPQGATGPQGPAGPQGAKGDSGVAGANGKEGKQGPQGSQGATGATGATGAAGATGPQGPAGPAGPAGPEGSIKETLPVNVEMKGTWRAEQVQASAAGEAAYANISFNIPLPDDPSAVFMDEGEVESPMLPLDPPHPFCEGGTQDPTVNDFVSDIGVLCIFTKEATNFKVERNLFGIIEAENNPLQSRFGVVLKGETEHSGPAVAYGTWAVVQK